jgi:hypothetical protein
MESRAELTESEKKGVRFGRSGGSSSARGEMDIDDPRQAKLGKIDGDVTVGLRSELLKAGPAIRSCKHQ